MPRPRGRSPIARCVSGSMPAVTKRSSSCRLLVEHADGRVARAGDLAGDVEELLEHRLDVELGDQRPPRIDQAPEAELIEDGR